MNDLLIACADVGSVANGNFGWADSDGAGGSNPSELATRIALALQAGRPVALGFECPLFVPLSVNERDIGRSRQGEGSKPWSAGAGCGALATGLVQSTWILTEIRKNSPLACQAHLAWESFEQSGPGLLVWEAFVSGSAKGLDHVDDARLAVKAFLLRMPRPQAAPYILDIDLDAFHSRKAITPDDPSTLHRLIRNAVAITIATEPECVDELWHDENDRMDSNELLAELMLHIEAAL